ncbi:MAG: hypothetical protein QOF21_1839 [Actinomycetota bacterium]|jgi:Flp pilus assembly pilin Flp
MNPSLYLLVWFQTTSNALRGRIRRTEHGQATAEYALVLLGAAAVAVLVVGWAAKTDRIGDLLDSVFDTVTGKIK